jgi:hypothetical protein
MPSSCELARQVLAGLVDVALALLALLGHEPLDLLVLARVQGREREVLELPLDRVDAEAVGDRRVDVERLARLVHLLLLGHRLDRAHVVQAVGELDQDDPDVGGHRDHHLAVVLGLRLVAGLEGDAGQLGDAVDEPGDLLAEALAHLLDRRRGVLDGVVQQRRAQRLGVQAHARADRATPTGCTMKSSPDLRRWSAWCSQANTNASWTRRGRSRRPSPRRARRRSRTAEQLPLARAAISAAPRPASCRARRPPRRRPPARPRPCRRARAPARRDRTALRRTAPPGRARSRGPRQRGGRRGRAGAGRRRSARRAGRMPRCCARTPCRCRRPGRSSPPGDGGARPGARRRFRSRPDASPPPPARSRRARPAGRSALRPRSGCASPRACARRWPGPAPGDLPGARGVIGEDQLEPGVGAVHAPRRVQPRREREADGALVDLAGVHPETAISARRPGLACSPARAGRGARACGSPPRSGTTSAIVASATRSRSRSSSQRASIARARLAHRRRRRRPLTAPARACRRPPSRTAPGRDSRTAAGCTIGASRQHAVGARRVVVGDHHLHAQRPGPRHLLDGGDRAVDRQQQPRAARRPAAARCRAFSP